MQVKWREAWEMARKSENALRHDHFRVKKRYFDDFERCFQPLSVGGFFPNQQNRSDGAPGHEPISVKTQEYGK